jgi:putative FmdB family regulatory protein
MPVYEYRCEKGHTFEVMQRMADDPLAECQVCGAPVQRVYHAPAVHFKGSGFYSTDYGKKKTAASNGKPDGGSDSGSESSSDSKSDSKSESKPDKKSESKSESKPAKKD